jgi:hypothetical protein
MSMEEKIQEGIKESKTKILSSLGYIRIMVESENNVSWGTLASLNKVREDLDDIYNFIFTTP